MMRTYDPLVSNPVGALTHGERAVLDNLERELQSAARLGVPWRVQAALIAGAALMLDALGSET